MLEWLQLIGLIILGVVVGNMIRRKFGNGGG